MKILNKGIANHVATAVFAVTALFGSVGCSASGSEDIGQITSSIGSTEPPQSIDTWAKLTQMTATGNYVLTKSLSGSGQTWTPKVFRGTFDGGGNTISNVTINTAGIATTDGAGFFSHLEGAIVRNVSFTQMKVTGRVHAGGVAGTAYDSLIEKVRVQGAIATSGAAGISAGGILGTGGNVTISQCAARGDVTGWLRYAGGIAGYLNAGALRSEVTQSYAWVTVTPDTSDVNRIVIAGGIVGWTFGATVKEVYAVGDVTGRGRVGGLVGSLTCDEGHPFVLNHGIYRGDVRDLQRTPASGGWEGTFGTFDNCPARFDQLYWDQSKDQSTVSGTYSPAPQRGATAQELMLPNLPGGGVYAAPDNTFESSIWDAGNENQHHGLKNAAGGLNIQPRCLSSTGQPVAC